MKAVTRNSSPHPANTSESAQNCKRIFRRGWALPALGVLAIVGGLLYWRRPTNTTHIARLTCQAYAESRQIVPRLAGCEEYPSRAAERGSESGDPIPLLEAKAQIAAAIVVHPDDPQWLHLQGRADLLSHNEDAAIAELERAHALLPKDAAILSDLGSGWFQKAAQGDDQPSALFSLAYDSFSKARELNCQDPALLFNQGLAAERIFAFMAAQDAWTQFLRVNSKSVWAKEAQAHMDGISRKLALQRAYAATTTPEALLAELGRGVHWGQLFAPDEEYIKIALTHLLPQYYGEPPDEGAGKILTSMGDAFRVLHKDPWIRDVLRTPHTAQAAEAFAALAEAVKAKDSDDWDRSLLNSRKALEGFIVLGNEAGAVRAQLDTLYSLRMRFDTAGCLNAEQPLERILRRYEYRWVQAQVLLEGALCEGWAGDFDRAWAKHRAAIQAATEYGYPVLLLRALDSNAAWQAQIGNVPAASQNLMRGLALFWTARYPFLRGFALYTDLSLMDDPRVRATYSAAAWAREASAAITSLDRPLFQAATLHQLALTEMRVGLREAAEKHLRDSALWIAKMSPADQARARLVYPIELAETEAAVGEVDRPLARLEPLRGKVQGALLNLRFHAILGRLHLRRGNYDEAKQLLTRAIEMGNGGWEKLSDAERLPWTHAIGDSYRALVECEIRNGDALSGSWRLWSRYRTALFDQAPAQGLMLQALQPGEAMLSLAEMPSGMGAWLRTQSGFYFRWLYPQTHNIREAAGRLVRSSANPHSPEAILRADARQFSQIVLGPWEGELNEVRELVIESDGPISAVPWPALVRSNGHYWSQDFAVRVRVAVSPAPAPRRALSSLKNVLTVGEPAIIRDSDLPPLPEAKREAEKVAALFRSSHALVGPAATLEAVREALPGAELFHFAGHGYGKAGGGLILRGNSGGPALLRATEIQGLHLSQCRLAVLSGCSTGSGERNGPGDPDSLVRAFLRAGARQVVASLWNLDSAAAQVFMSAFYTGIVTDAPVDESLRRAAAAVRAQSEYRHPYYWAGLQDFEVQ